MDTIPGSHAPLGIRWLVAILFLIVCASLASFLASRSAIPHVTLQTLALLAIAAAVYACAFYPPAGSVAISGAALIMLGWVLAARPASGAGWALPAFSVLVGVAASDRWRLSRRVQHLSQVLDDLSEERAVKDQAIAVADQAREALHKKLARYTQLQTIAEELSNMTDLGSIAQLAVERTFSLIGKSDACLLFLVDQEHQKLALFASKKLPSIPAIRAKHGDQFDRYVLRTHRPLLVNDVRRDFRFTVSASPERAIGSVIACPLLMGQSPQGVLRLDSAQPGAYTQDDLRFLDILLDLITAAVTNAKLFAQTQQLAMTDGLTGLTLRRPFMEHLTRELLRSRRHHEPASVLMVDVDHFKRFNDTFGHTAGDLILKGVAEVLRAVVPPDGLIARYGGEEFVVLLPHVTRVSAADVAEKIRQIVAQQVQLHSRGGQRAGDAPSPNGGITPPPAGAPRREAGQQLGDIEEGCPPGHRRGPAGGGVTVSLGVATYPDDAKVEEELLRVADHRLYQAKSAGRNRVCTSS